MKRILSVIFMLGCFFIFQSPFAHANYPNYLNRDRNFILSDGHMGTGWYVDKSSLVVQQYAPPIYRIAVNLVWVPDADRGNGNPSEVETNYFLYNWDTRSMYVLRDGTWNYIPHNGSFAQSGIVEPTGEMVFYIAYHMPFYGGHDYLYALVDESN